MTTNETQVFIYQIVNLHHAGDKLQARAVLKALESALRLDTPGMNSLYRKIEILERELGFVEDGRVLDPWDMDMVKVRRSGL